MKPLKLDFDYESSQLANYGSVNETLHSLATRMGVATLVMQPEPCAFFVRVDQDATSSIREQALKVGADPTILSERGKRIVNKYFSKRTFVPLKSEKEASLLRQYFGIREMPDFSRLDAPQKLELLNAVFAEISKAPASVIETVIVR